MIVAVMDAGFVVAANDHVGHGATAILNGTWGDWGEAGPHTMMEDETRFKDIVCEKYPGLPYFMFSHSMGSMIVRDFIDMMLCIEGAEWAQKVSTDLPILLVAGDQDPVGNFDEGVYACANWLADTGHDVTTKLYSGYRHEIHNYDDIKFDVEMAVVEWMIMQL